MHKPPKLGIVGSNPTWSAITGFVQLTRNDELVVVDSFMKWFGKKFVKDNETSLINKMILFLNSYVT
jgi:hypothetical protein